MYLFHLLTSVYSTEHLFASGSHVPLLSTSTHFSRRAIVSWFSFSILMRDLGRHRGKHHCFLLSLAPITFDANTFSCYCGSYFAIVAVIFFICRRPLSMVGPSMPTSPSLFITTTIACCSEYVHLQNFLLPLSLPPPRAL
jgi:hypothetical protein